MPGDAVRLGAASNPYPLFGWLFRRSWARFCRWSSPGWTRECTNDVWLPLRPIGADAIGRRVYADAARFVPALAGGWAEATSELVARFTPGLRLARRSAMFGSFTAPEPRPPSLPGGRGGGWHGFAWQAWRHTASPPRKV